MIGKEEIGKEETTAITQVREESWARMGAVEMEQQECLYPYLRDQMDRTW